MIDAGFRCVEGEGVAVRRFRADDADALAAYRSDPEVARHQGFEPCSADEAGRFIESLQKRSPGEPGEWFQFAISRKPDGPLLGDLALRCTQGDPRLAELGFSLARKSQRQGIAGAAIRTLLDYAFPALGLHRVHAVTDERNAAARRLLERLGFRREAHFVKASWFKGAWSSELVYATLRDEWSQRTRDDG